jgi:hypothetical protein
MLVPFRPLGPAHAVPGLRWRPDHGAVTAEYAIATIAAVGFAGLLVVVLRSDAVRGMLTDLIRHALALPG